VGALVVNNVVGPFSNDATMPIMDRSDQTGGLFWGAADAKIEVFRIVVQGRLVEQLF
jgi:hypothetical protein